MISMSVKSDIKQVTRYLDNIQRKQVPFAQAKALTQTAKAAADAEAKALDRTFDRPTPFTRRAFYIKPATKRNPTATIGLKAKQQEYLGLQIAGGIRFPHRRAIPVPVNARTNKYGNRTRGLIARLLKRDDTFSGKPKGHPGAHEGIYQRPRRTKRKTSKPIKLQVAYRKTATYRPRWQFHRNLARHAARIFPARMRAALQDAIRTAK